MSSASTINLPYENTLLFTVEIPNGIISRTNFFYTIIDNQPIPAGNYLVSIYMDIIQEGNDTELGIITTQLRNSTGGGDLVQNFPVTSNYLSNNQFIVMDSNYYLQNTQFVQTTATITLAISGNIAFDNTAPSGTGYLILKAI